MLPSPYEDCTVRGTVEVAMAGLIGDQPAGRLAPAFGLRAAVGWRAALGGVRAPLLCALAFVLLVVAPFVVGTLGAPPGTVFGGTLKALGDEGVYMAAVNAGSRGEWLWHDPFMVATPPPILMYPTYLIAGHVGALAGLSVRASYLWFHLVAALALFGALWALGRPYLERGDRPWFVAFALGTSGLYWLDALFSMGGSAPVSLPWMGMPQLGGLTLALMGAHETLGVAGQLAVFTGLLGSVRLGGSRAWWYVLYGGLGTLVVGLTLPMLLPGSVGVAALFACWWGMRTAGDARRRTAIAAALSRAALICLPGLLIALYYYRELTTGVWGASNYRFVGSRPFMEGFLMWGVVLPLAIWGWRAAPRSARPLATMLGLWCGFALLATQLPFWQGFRFSTGLNVMVGALFGLGIVWRVRSRPWRLRWLVLVSLGGLTHLLLLLPVLATGQAHHLYGTVQEDRAMRWLGAHTAIRDVVLAPLGFSNGLPAFAHCRTVVGHDWLTFDMALRSVQLRTFYGSDQPIGARLAALRATGATYVVYDATDGEDGPFDPRGLPGLRTVFAAPGVAVLRVGSV